MPGTVYVCPGLFGDPYPWSDPAAGIRFMTVREMPHARLARSATRRYRHRAERRAG